MLDTGTGSDTCTDVDADTGTNTDTGSSPCCKDCSPSLERACWSGDPHAPTLDPREDSGSAHSFTCLQEGVCSDGAMLPTPWPWPLSLSSLTRSPRPLRGQTWVTAAHVAPKDSGALQTRLQTRPRPAPCLWPAPRLTHGSDFRETRAPPASPGRMALRDCVAFLGTEGSPVQW